MMKNILFACLLAGALLPLQVAMAEPGGSDSGAAIRYPLLFTENAGQWDPSIRYASLLPSRGIWVSRDGLRLVAGIGRNGGMRNGGMRNGGGRDGGMRNGGGRLRGRALPGERPVALNDVLRSASLRFVGASSRLRVAADRKSGSVSHFYLGNDPARWREGLPNYERVLYRDVWKNIDVGVAGGNGNALVATMTVHPGGSVSHIGLLVEGDLLSLKPASLSAYQIVEGRRIAVPVAVRTGRGGELRPVAGRFDPATPLIVEAEFSTYFGGGEDDQGYAVVVDEEGGMSMAGLTLSGDFPLQRPWQGQGRVQDVFLAKFLRDGRTLSFSTYYGGSLDERDVQAKAGAEHSIVLVGTTASDNFPLSATAALRTRRDHFIGRFDSAGTMRYSSYLWDDGLEDIYGMTTDRCGGVYLVADTKDYTNPPIVTPGAIFPTNQGIEDLFIMKINADCDRLLYATCMGGPAHEESNSIAVDPEGNIIVVGTTYFGTGYPVVNAFQPSAPGQEDVVVTKIRADGSAIIFSTFLGGGSHEALSTQPFDTFLATDDAGNIYVTGVTRSSDFPMVRPAKSTISGSHDIFLTKFTPAGKVVFSTFFGGDFIDYIKQLAVDPSGYPVLAGLTQSSDFPLLHPKSTDGQSFVSIFDSSGSGLAFSTRWGTPGRIAAAASGGFLYITGTAEGIFDPPIFNAWQPTCNSGSDAFLSRLVLPDYAPPPSPLGSLRVTIQLPDTVRIGYSTHVVTPNPIPVRVTLRNITVSTTVTDIAGRLQLPPELGFDPKGQSPTVVAAQLLPGDSLQFTWTVAVDSLPQQSGYYPIRFVCTAKDPRAPACAATQLAWKNLPVLLADEGRMTCNIMVQDSLGVQASGTQYMPNPFTVQFSMVNTSGKQLGVYRLRLVLPRGMGLEAVPPGDTLHNGFVLKPGASGAATWLVLARTRNRPRTAGLCVVALDSSGAIIGGCCDSLFIPALAAPRCLTADSSIVYYNPATGMPEHDTLSVSFSLDNPIDTAQVFLGAELDLSHAPHLAPAAGDSLTRPPFTIGAHAMRGFTWRLRVKEPLAAPSTDTIFFRAMRAPGGEETSCMLLVRFRPLNRNFICALYAPSFLSVDSANGRYRSNPFTAVCVVRNASLTAIGGVTAELTATDSAAARIAPPARQRLAMLSPGGADTLTWSVEVLTSSYSRSIALAVQVADSAGLPLSRCAVQLAAPAIPLPPCKLWSTDTIRYDAENDVFIPDPFTATFELENRLDTAMTGIEAEISLGQAPHIILASGETPRRSLPNIPPGATARLSWLLRIVNPDSSVMTEQVTVCYRTAADTAWRCCSLTIVLEPRKKNILILCGTMGHDTVWTDAASGGCIPLPIQVRYTIRNRGSVPLTLCSAAILPPAGYYVMPGTDSVQTYENIMPQMDRSREWLLGLDPARARAGKDSVRWVWGCQGMRLDTSCVHEVTLLVRPPDGVVFTPWVLRFRARQFGPLPRAQNVRFWTGRGLSVPWQLQPDVAWLDVQPLAGDSTRTVDARPNTTSLALGEYAGAIGVAARSPMFRSSIEVIYVVDDTTSGIAAPVDAGTPALEQNYPNPARGATNVVFRLPARTRISLSLHDVLGRAVAELADAELDAGEHRIALDASRYAPGVYILVLHAQSGTLTRILTIE